MKLKKIIAALTLIALCGCVGGCGSTNNDEPSILDDLKDAAIEGTSRVIVDTVSNKIQDTLDSVHDDPKPEPGPMQTGEFEEKSDDDSEYLPQGFYVDLETGNLEYDDSLVDETLLYWDGRIYEYESSMDYYLIVDGDKFTLPMTVKEITDMGWEITVFTEDADEILPGTYAACKIEKNDVEMNIDLRNKTKEVVSWEDCVLSKISVHGSDWLDRIPEIEVCYGVNFDMHSKEINGILSKYDNLRKQDESNISIQYWDELPEDQYGIRRYAGCCYVGLFDYDGDIVADSIMLEYLGK